jgi:hypothetical protein
LEHVHQTTADVGELAQQMRGVIVDASDVNDSHSQYEASIDWLSGSKNDNAAQSVSVDLQSHFSPGRS